MRVYLLLPTLKITSLRNRLSYLLLALALIVTKTALSQAPAYLQQGPFATRNADLLEYMNKQRPAARPFVSPATATGATSRQEETGPTLTRQEAEQLEKQEKEMQHGIWQSYKSDRYDEVVQNYPDFTRTVTFERLSRETKFSLFKIFLNACARTKDVSVLKKGFNHYSYTVTSYSNYLKPATEQYGRLLAELGAYREAAEAYEEAKIVDAWYLHFLIKLNEPDRLIAIDCNALNTLPDMCLYYKAMACSAKGDEKASRRWLEESANTRYAPAILELFYRDLRKVSAEDSRKRLQQYQAGYMKNNNDYIQALLTSYLFFEEWAPAKQVVDSLLRTDPQHALPWLIHGMTAWSENKIAPATAAFIKANALEPDNEYMLMAATDFFRTTRQPEQLETLCRQAMGRNRQQKIQVLAGFELARWYTGAGKANAETCIWLLEAKKWKIDSADQYVSAYCSAILADNLSLEELLGLQESEAALLKIKNKPDLLHKPVKVNGATSSVLGVLLRQKDTVAVQQLLEWVTPVLPMHESDPAPVLMAWSSMPLAITILVAQKGGIAPGQKIKTAAAAPYFKRATTAYPNIAHFLYYSVVNPHRVEYNGPKKAIDSLLPLLKYIPAGTIIEYDHTIYDKAMMEGVAKIVGYYAAQPGHPWYRFQYAGSFHNDYLPGHNQQFSEMLQELHAGRTDSAGNTFAHLFLYKLRNMSEPDIRWYLDQFKANGFNLKQKNKEGKTPLDMALMNPSLNSKEDKGVIRFIKQAAKAE